MAIESSARNIDHNGFVTIERNPISRSGVFPYLGRSIGAPNPDQVYYVYRPDSELSDPEAIESFKLIPFVDDHTMLGPEEDGFVPAEMKGVHGSTGEDVEFEGGVLYAKLKIFSQFLKTMLQNKRDISLGYRCIYEKVSGVFNGQSYQYIQRKLRGNHLALVDEARCAVSVLDGKDQFIAYDHFDINLKEFIMADENTENKDTDKKGDGETEMSLADAVKLLKQIVPQVKAMQEHLASMSGEEETETVDAEEKASQEKASKDAKDAAEKEEAEKKAKDEKDKDEKKGMDSKLSKIAQDVSDIKTGKSFLVELNKRNALAEKISYVVGAFDHAEMTLSDVAKYGNEKMGLNAPVGSEIVAIDAYLAGRKTVQGGVVALDSSRSGKSKLGALIKSKAS